MTWAASRILALGHADAAFTIAAASIDRCSSLSLTGVGLLAHETVPTVVGS